MEGLIVENKSTECDAETNRIKDSLKELQVASIKPIAKYTIVVTNWLN